MLSSEIFFFRIIHVGFRTLCRPVYFTSFTLQVRFINTSEPELVCLPTDCSLFLFPVSLALCACGTTGVIRVGLFPSPLTVRLHIYLHGQSYIVPPPPRIRWNSLLTPGNWTKTRTLDLYRTEAKPSRPAFSGVISIMELSH